MWRADVRSLLLLLLVLTQTIAQAARHGQPLGPWERCVFVANDHGQVLAEWLEASSRQREQEPLTVLHIDAHGDLNVPEGLPADRFESTWRGNATRRHELAEAADLANFQQFAAWVGLVDHVIWIRQGWGPGERHDFSLCFDAATGAFTESIGAQTCQSAADGGSQRATSGRELLVHEVPEQALLDAATSRELLGYLRGKPYILDIDLDFFVQHENVPGKPPWLEDMLVCPRPCKRWTDVDCTHWEGFEAQMATGDPFLQSGCGSSAVAAWHQLGNEHKMLMGNLHTSERLLVLGQLLGQASRAELDALHLDTQLRRLEEFFTMLRAHPPVLTTVARSADLFTSILDVPRLEEATLKLVLQMWGVSNTSEGEVLPLCVKYAPGTAALSDLPLLQDFGSVDL